jgi:hypothetical protein
VGTPPQPKNTKWERSCDKPVVVLIVFFDD